MTAVGMKRPCLSCGVSGESVLVRCPECGYENEAAVIHLAGDMRGEKALSILPKPEVEVSDES